MCGRYASSRRPEDLVEEFEIRNPDLPSLEPDFNVAPTKEVYAVVERPPKNEHSGDKDAVPERQLRALQEIVRHTDAAVYLLDEWDANLDPNNRAAADELVEELARRARVVEISHRDRV